MKPEPMLSTPESRARMPEVPEPILPGRTPAPATLDAFCDAARALKAAEEAYRAAQQSYAEAVKQMSEEAVR